MLHGYSFYLFVNNTLDSDYIDDTLLHKNGFMIFRKYLFLLI